MLTHLRQSAVFLAVLASLCLCAVPSFAATSVRDELSTEARNDWDAARELYDAGDYRSALVHFEKAYELSKNPRVLFNVGVCWKDLTQYALAIRVWERALGFRDRLSADDVQKLEFAVSAARPFVSTMKLESDQMGALLSIDGNEIGKTPFVEPIPIDVGRRKVTLSKDGFAVGEKTVDVVQGSQVVLAMKLMPLQKTGSVTIAISGAAGATLFMDGRELGPAPFSGDVPEGPHTFEARAPGYYPTRQTSDVLYGKTLRLALSLAKAQNEGKVRILVDHADAVIRIDGNVKGRGGWEGILSVGGHQLVVEKSAYEDFTQEVSLSQGQERTVQVQLHKKPSWIWWTVGIATVVGGGTVAAVLLSRPTDTSSVSGTLDTVAPRF
jgi:tetratricopeptide (TPR) repeat protein